MSENWDGSNRSPPIITFNRVAYRIDCETIGADIKYDVLAHAGNRQATSTFAAVGTVTTVPGEPNGTWETTNGQNTVKYNGTGVTYVGANSTGQGAFQGRRSFNQDASLSDVQDITPAAPRPDSGVASILYDPPTTTPSLLAAKDYVTAAASVTHGSTTFTSPRGNNTSRGVLDGYEGVFRSVLMLGRPNIGEHINYRVQGSNVQNANPTIPGFPVHDNDQTDWRFSKYTYKYNTTGNGDYLWVSTDIVSPWYIIIMGPTDDVGGHVQRGMVKNYLYAGYGDVFMSYNQ
jgi:hypothetical protein